MAVKPVRYHFDRILLWYLAVIFAVTFVGCYRGYLYLFLALLQLIMLFIVLRITGARASTGRRIVSGKVYPLFRWLDPLLRQLSPQLRRLSVLLRWFYPLLLLGPLHYEIAAVGTLFHGGVLYDPWIAALDRALFQGNPHRWLVLYAFPGPVWKEVLHFFYFTYYPIVAGGFLYAWLRGQHAATAGGLVTSTDFLRYAFVFLGSFLTYMVIFILFPVQGPLEDRILYFSDPGVLGRVIDFFYRVGDSAAGAIPSSHVGESVVVYLLLRPKRQWTRVLSLALISGLAISTVYGSFHYALDALTGLISGPLFYLFWSWVYRRLKPEAPARRESAEILVSPA
jgi:membrane-associated phospholipid phosphatase